MSHTIHLNQLPVMLAEQNDDEGQNEARGLSHALRFLEGIDYEDDALRERRRRRAQRAAGGIAGFTAARAATMR